MLYIGIFLDTIEQTFFLQKDHLWNQSYFVAVVSENTENQIKEYIRKQKTKGR